MSEEELIEEGLDSFENWLIHLEKCPYCDRDIADMAATQKALHVASHKSKEVDNDE